MNSPVVESTLTSIGSDESLSTVHFPLLKASILFAESLVDIWTFTPSKGAVPCNFPLITVSTTVISLISACLEVSVTCFTVKLGASISPDVVVSV